MTLEKFKIGLELDVTWNEARQQLKQKVKQDKTLELKAANARMVR